MGALLGLLTNKGGDEEPMEPPPLLDKLLGQDGEEMSLPLKGALDKIGGGDGPLSTVKMFIPPIGQGGGGPAAGGPTVIFIPAGVCVSLVTGGSEHRQLRLFEVTWEE